jgi:hypothetical protein
MSPLLFDQPCHIHLGALPLRCLGPGNQTLAAPDELGPATAHYFPPVHKLRPSSLTGGFTP